MARKVFLSILGTNYYYQTRYYFGDEPNKKEKVNNFIQVAILEKLISEEGWNSEDKVIIFLTKEARENNWVDIAQQNNNKKQAYTGLDKSLKEKMNIEAKPVTINEGFNKNEILSIFDEVYSQLEEGDELYFDITHAFRYMPMLVMVLINYAKFLLGVKIKQITYGAFEKLGPAYKVKEIPIEKRLAPVLDLTYLSEIQDWTNAINNYRTSGNGNALTEIISKESKNNNVQALQQVSNKLSKFTDNFATVRGKEIISGKNANDLYRELKTTKKKTNIPQLSPLVDELMDEVAGFKNNYDIINGFNAIDWCINHNLYQQAVTLMQELMINYVMEKHISDCNNFKDIYENRILDEANIKEKKETYIKKKSREYFSSILGVINKKESTPENRKGLLKNVKIKELTEQLLECDDLKQIGKHYQSVSNERNSINHGGMIDSIESKDLKDKIKEKYDELVKDLKQCS